MTPSRFRTWICLFAIVSLAGTNVFADDNESSPADVFLLIGQSNMAGRAPLEDSDREAVPGVSLLNADGKWEPAQSPLNRFASNRKVLSMQRMGPGDGFIRRLRALRPDRTIGLIVNARGGSRIEEWGEDQPYYVNTLKRWKRAGRPKIAGILWHQGEGNANDPDYLDKLAKLVARLRSDLNDPAVPFVAGEVYGDRPVNKLIGKLPETVDRTAVVSVESLNVFDGVHFDRKGQLTLGARYADAWIRLTAPQSDK